MGAGLGMVGGALIGAGSAYGEYLASKKQNQWNLERRNDAWRREERLANTAHQREVTDLRKAGLNPILSAGGGGASSPVGGMISSTDPAKGIASGASTALEASRLKSQLGILDKQNKILDADVSSAGALKRFIDSDPQAYAAGKISKDLGFFGRFMHGIKKRFTSDPKTTYYPKFEKSTNKRHN